jgi:hypothetical protein
MVAKELIWKVRLTSAVSVCAMTILTAGCQKPFIEGDAFITKGPGDIKPAAGQTVYLIPSASSAEVLRGALQGKLNEQQRLVESGIQQSCQKASDFLAARTKLIADEEHAIDSSLREKRSPECSGAQIEFDKLDSATQRKRGEIRQNTADLESRLRELQMKKTIEVSRIATSLQDKASNEVLIRIYPEFAGYFRIGIENRSQYCLKEINKLEFSIKGRAIQVREPFFFNSGILGTERDQYGFETGCGLSPQSTRRIDGLFNAPSVRSDPRLALTASEFNLPIKDGYLMPDSVKGTFRFAEGPFVRKEGDRLTYSTKNVDFSSIAANSAKFPEDREIEATRSRIAKIERDSEMDNLNATRSEALRRLNVCKSDQVEHASLEKRLESLRADRDLAANLTGKLKNCLAPKSDEETAQTTFRLIAEKFRVRYSVEKREALSGKASVELLMEHLKGEGVAKVDASINGSFKFIDVKNGSYVLFATHGTPSAGGFWLAPVQVNGNLKFDLNNNNFNPVPLDFYLGYQSKKACAACNAKEWAESLASVDEVKAEYQRLLDAMEEALEKLRDTVRRLRR